MAKYILKRLAQSLLTIFLVVCVVFLLMRLLPNDYYFTEEQLIKLTDEQQHDILEKAGMLDHPLVQLGRYFKGILLHGDFGVSHRIQTGKSTLIMGIAMIAFYWLGTARNVRNLVFMYRDREYNLASRCLGTPLMRILGRNIFPYLVSVIILRLALSIPGIIAYETTLSYLGLLDISTPSLGILLRNARSYFLDYPYLLVFPAAIVSLITITFYLVGNAFSDACDPRNHV